MKLIFTERGWEDYQHWVEADARVLARLNDLIKISLRDPFRGSGKPEPLKGDLKGFWSRRITKEDRLVYRVSGKSEGQRLEIVQCRFHY